MEMNFCRRCGAPLKGSSDHVYQCSNGHMIFANAVPAAGIWLLNDRNEILAAIRRHDPGKGMIDSPGGFTDGAETYEDSIRREVKEELGLEPTDYTAPELFLSGLDAYNYAGERFDVLTAIFVARIKGSPEIRPQDDVERAEFLSPETINPEDIAFATPRAAFIKLRDLLQSGENVVKNN